MNAIRFINDRIQEAFKEDPFLPLVVKAIRKEPDLLAYKIQSPLNQMIINDPRLMNVFNKNKKLASSIAIFQEFVKELASVFCVKELVIDHLISSYEKAKMEDTKFECAMALF